MGLAAAVTAVDLVAEAHDAVAVGEVEALGRVEVLDLEEGAAVVEVLEAHALRLSRPVRAGEHSVLPGAGVADPGEGLGLAGPLVAAAVARGRDTVNREEEEAGDGSDHGWGLHGGSGEAGCSCCERAGREREEKLDSAACLLRWRWREEGDSERRRRIVSLYFCETPRTPECSENFCQADPFMIQAIDGLQSDPEDNSHREWRGISRPGERRLQFPRVRRSPGIRREEILGVSVTDTIGCRRRLFRQPTSCLSAIPYLSGQGFHAARQIFISSPIWSDLGTSQCRLLRREVCYSGVPPGSSNWLRVLPRIERISEVARSRKQSTLHA